MSYVNWYNEEERKKAIQTFDRAWDQITKENPGIDTESLEFIIKITERQKQIRSPAIPKETPT